jgi:S1-C subfamily serine protease
MDKIKIVAVVAIVFMVILSITTNNNSNNTGAGTLTTNGSQDYLSFKTQDEANNIEIFKKASRSVVYVTNKALRRDFFAMNVQEIPQGTGTGFVWDDSGIIVTNFHVIQGASRVTVTLQDHTELDAKVIGVAPDKDLAILKVESKTDLYALPLGDSALLEVGRKVIAIGNPFGLDTTLTVGVVSALGREIDAVTDRKIRGVIQTDASINPGNSGGPLLNSLGQLVGVNTAIFSPSGASAGIGFAIPVNTVKKIVPQLIEYGQVNTPVMGIEVAPDHWARRYDIKGVVVVQTVPRQFAAKAGIKGISRNRRGAIVLGDVITQVSGVRVNNFDEYLAVLEQHKAGDTIEVVTQRDGEELEYSIELSAPSR